MLAALDHIRAAGMTPVAMAPPDGPLAEELAARDVELIPFRVGQAVPDMKVENMHQRIVRHSLTYDKASVRRRLEEILLRRRPLLLHANSLSMGRLSGPVAARLCVPSIAHLRDIIRLSARAADDLNCHTRLLAVSEAVRRFHVSGGVDAEKFHVLHNGVDLDEYRPRPPTGYLHRELGLPADALLVGTVGQIGLRKGQDVLLRAAATTANRAPQVHFLIVGERNSEKEESRRFEADLHRASEGALAGRVHFLGRRGDVAALLNELTLLVHPARQEPLGRVLLEAAAAAAPVVATAVGGTPEIFPPHSHAARLVKPDDPAALAAAMLELLGDEPLRRRIALAARLRAETAFDAATTAKNLLKHYHAVAAL